MFLGNIIAGSSTAVPSANPDITGLTLNSAAVLPGYMFFAVKGAKTDGHRFIDDAVKRGAAAVAGTDAPPAGLSVPYVRVTDMPAFMARCARAFYGHPSAALKLVGITGTNGKTTTSYFLEAIYEKAGLVPAVIGTINYRIGGRVLAAAPNTTPVSLHLSQVLAQARDEGSRAAVMEVSSQAIAFGRVEGLEFDAGMFLNLSQDHLDYHRTMDAYFAEKKKLFLRLNESPKRNKIAVLNADAPESNAIAWELDKSVRPVWFGMKTSRGYFASAVKHTLAGSWFYITAPNGIIYKARINLWGGHNVANALAAFACAVETGIAPETALAGLEALACVPGRMQRVNMGQNFHVFVDFAHTPDGLEKTLSNVAALKTGKIYTVFGCGGDRDRAKRPLMARVVCAKSDLAFVTSDNPRTEDPKRIFKDITDGLAQTGEKNFVVIEDRRAAIAAAFARARENDIVILAGKGHEQGQILKDRVIPFCDAGVAAEELTSLQRGTNGVQS